MKILPLCGSFFVFGECAKMSLWRIIFKSKKVDGRQGKRIIISLVYLLVFLLIIGLVYYLKFYKAPSCTDGVQNQNEEGVDCGGICPQSCTPVAQDLIVGKMGVVPSGIAGKYDYYVQITNPNATFGDKVFYYTLNLKDADGKVIATRNGSSFILPGEQKYVVETNIETGSGPASYDFKINSSDWVEFNIYYEKPDLQIVNKQYDEISGGTGFSEAYGLLKNRSPYDFDLIKIEIFLKDDNGTILAINSTQMSTVASGEQRDFKVSWPNRFSGTVANMETQTEVNVFKSDTFMQKTYKREKFQQY